MLTSCVEDDGATFFGRPVLDAISVQVRSWSLGQKYGGRKVVDYCLAREVRKSAISGLVNRSVTSASQSVGHALRRREGSRAARDVK